MDSKNIYYVKVEFTLESQQYITGIRNPLCLVVAENEDEAIKLMKNFLNAKGAMAAVSIPEDATEEVGHGLSVKQYLEDSKHRNMTWREIINAYKDRYCRYELQILDERGEIIWQNEYTHPENFPKPPKPLKNKYVPLYIEDADKLDSGIAFAADETEGDSQAWIVTAEHINTEDDDDIIKQCRYMANGALQTRECVNGVWTEWEHVYVEEIPNEDKYFMRHYDESLAESGFPWVWKGYTWDSQPKSGSKQLVNSGAVYSWVHNMIAKMYEMCGTAKVAELNALKLNSGVDVGNVYNVEDRGTINGGSVSLNVTFIDNMLTKTSLTAIKSIMQPGDTLVINGVTYTIGDYNTATGNFAISPNIANGTYPTTWNYDALEVNAGDNVLWTGYSWDVLSHFIDSELYVKFTDRPTKDTSGAVKVYSDFGIAINSDQRLYIVRASDAEIANRSAGYKPITPGNLDYAVRSVLPLTADELPENNTLVANTEYYLGEAGPIVINFPETGKLGQYCFVCFKAASTSLTARNYVGQLPSVEVGKTYQIYANWDGSNWICQWLGY